MKFRCITKLVFLFLTLFASPIAAEEMVIPYTVENSCPFEGCSYGSWDVLKETPVYKEPDVNSGILGTLLVGTKANIETGISFIIPGKAKISGEPYKTAKKLDRDAFIFILNYLGEGYSRIYQNGEIIEAKVARTKERCSENPNWRYCWVDIIEEPIDQWWVKVKDSGWVPMDDNPLKPIDVLSRLMPHNKHLRSEPADAGVADVSAMKNHDS